MRPTSVLGDRQKELKRNMQASLLMDFARKEVIVKMQNRGAKLRFELGIRFSFFGRLCLLIGLF